MTAPLHVAITGAAGQIGYAMTFRIASGEVFGAHRPVVLHLIEVPPVMPQLDGVHMELDDCAFSALAGVQKFDSEHLEQAMADCNWVLLVGSIPRKQGMERGDLIRVNGPIFTSTGRAIEASAASDVRVLVVGNPCNTNCLIAMHSAPDVPRERFSAMTRLDQNRAQALLALKAGVATTQVRNTLIWGNHSATQVPDFLNTTVHGKPAASVIGDRTWLEGEFFATVQKRGAAIIDARGASSAASAANALIDHVRDLRCATPSGGWRSVCVASDGSYGVPPGLVSSFPVRADGKGGWQIVKGLPLDAFFQGKLGASVAELEQERAIVAHLLG